MELENINKLSMSLVQKVEDAINSNKVMMFSKSYCPFCVKAKDALKDLGVDFEVMSWTRWRTVARSRTSCSTRPGPGPCRGSSSDKMADGSKVQDIMFDKTGARSVPRVFVNGKFVGGGDKTVAMKKSGELLKS